MTILTVHARARAPVTAPFPVVIEPDARADADKENSAFYKHINRHEFRKGGKFAPTWPAPAKKGGDADDDDDDDDLIPEIF